MVFHESIAYVLLFGIFFSFMVDMSKYKAFRFFLCLPMILGLFACSARIEGLVREGGEAEISLKTSLEPRTTSLLRSLRGFMGEASSPPILDGESISRSMAAAPGIRAVSLKNTGQETLEGTILISQVGDFLSSGGNTFITYTQGRESGRSSIVVVLDLNSAPGIISRLSPEVEEYLSALMAPAAQGERMTRQEYLALVASIYGKPLADEIAAARILAGIEFPRQIVSIRGGNAVGRRAEFDVPLQDILVLEEPLRYEVNW